MSRNKIKTVVVVSDIHLPYEDHKATQAFLSFLKDHKIDELVLNGDILDLASMSSHGDAGAKALMDEVAYANDWLDDLRNIVGSKCKLHYVEGNHEQRMERYIAQNAANLDGVTDLPTLLRLKQRRIGWTPYGEVHFISPKLGVTHGIFCGQHFAKQHLDRYGTSLVVGHTHRAQVHTLSVAGEAADSARGCFGLGTLVDVSRVPYIKGPTGWTNGFGVFYVLPDGTFTAYPVMMTKRRFVWGGKIYG
jgi:predicted phosphodiesterase